MSSPEQFRDKVDQGMRNAFDRNGYPIPCIFVHGETSGGERVAVIRGRIKTGVGAGVHIGWLVMTSSNEEDLPIHTETLSMDGRYHDYRGTTTTLTLSPKAGKDARRVLTIQTSGDPLAEVVLDGMLVQAIDYISPTPAHVEAPELHSRIENPKTQVLAMTGNYL